MTRFKSAPILPRIGLVAAALVLPGCWYVQGDLGEFTEGSAESSGDATSSDDPGGSTTGPDAPGSGTAAPTSTGGDENGELTCPEGHPKLAPLWTAHLTVDPNVHFLQPALEALSDGRIAVAGGNWQPPHSDWDGDNGGVLWLGGDGVSQGWTFGPTDHPGYGPVGLRRAPDDSLVTLGFAVQGDQHLMRLTRIPGDGAPVTVVDADLGHIAWPSDFVLVGDSAVVIGRGAEEEEPFVMWVARVDLATGALEWEVSPPSVHPVLGLQLAVGPNGEIVAAHGTAGSGAEFKLWRLGDDGSVLWTADLLEPPGKFMELIDVVVTPGEQVVAIMQHYWPAKITAHAVGLAEGELRWATQVAIEDESGSPAFGGALLDPDALALPIGRAPEPYVSGNTADPLSASLVRLSFTGEVLDDTPLPLTDLTAGRQTLMPARGKCGDLLLLHIGNTETHRLWSFAP